MFNGFGKAISLREFRRKPSRIPLEKRKLGFSQIRVEELESRLVPDGLALNWQGAIVSDWTDPQNWVKTGTNVPSP